MTRHGDGAQHRAARQLPNLKVVSEPANLPVTPVVEVDLAATLFDDPIS